MPSFRCDIAQACMYILLMIVRCSENQRLSLSAVADNCSQRRAGPAEGSPGYGPGQMLMAYAWNCRVLGERESQSMSVDARWWMEEVRCQTVQPAVCRSGGSAVSLYYTWKRRRSNVADFVGGTLSSRRFAMKYARLQYVEGPGVKTRRCMWRPWDTTLRGLTEREGESRSMCTADEAGSITVDF